MHLAPVAHTLGVLASCPLGIQCQPSKRGSFQFPWPRAYPLWSGYPGDDIKPPLNCFRHERWPLTSAIFTLPELAPDENEWIAVTTTHSIR